MKKYSSTLKRILKRPNPIGYDSKGYQYWYFGNSSEECTCRVYKEFPTKIDKYTSEMNAKWEVV